MEAQMERRIFCLLGLLFLSGASCRKEASTIESHKSNGRALSLNAALEDIDFFFRTVEQVHPNHLANISTKEYKSLKHRCREALRLECQRNNGISKAFLALTVAEAAASFGDGHTYCSPGLDLINVSDPSVLMPPFKLEWQAGHIVIGDTTSGLESIEGTRLLKINGIAMKEFLKPVLAKISGEREANRISRFLNKQQIYWALLRPVPQDHMEIIISRGIEEPHTMKVGLIDLPGYTQTFGQESGYPEPSRYWFCQGDNTCYWRYNSFNYSESGRKHIDTVFSDIREKKAENLIIDLRFNGGGNSMAAKHILNYITSKPYCLYSGSDMKISRQLPHKEQFGVFSIFLRGRIIKYRSKGKLKKPADMGYRFGGRVYALTGPVTFSSASDFAAVLKDFDIATLVGEETGGVRECFGDAPRFPLPNSGIQFGVSHKRWYAPIPKPRDDKHGTMPDIPVNDELLAPFMDADDPVLAFTLDMIEKEDRM
jgi:hypothetical protein